MHPAHGAAYLSARRASCRRLRPVAVPLVRLVLAFVVGLALWPVLWAVGRMRRGPHRPWAIGGHRGRTVEDNSAALYRWMLARTAQPVVWIGNADVAARLRAEGLPVLVRHSLAARLAVFSAPLVVYSHGQDDLDVLGHLWRRTLGLSAFLNHTLTVYKGGDAFSPDYEAAGPLGQWLRRLAMTDFDVALASSDFEQACIQRAFPYRAGCIRARGGGAHLDAWFWRRGTPATKTIYWFPTHRDTPEGRALLAEALHAVTTHARLRRWLLDEGYTLRIGRHINTGDGAVSLDLPFEGRTTATLLDDLATAALFVSDYSGLVANHMLFDRPLVLFPFDRETYLRHRHLYTPIETLATGPVCDTVEAFVETLVSGAWRDTDASRARRAAWQQRLFVHDAPVYAEHTYRALCDELAAAGASAATSNGPAGGRA